MPRGGYHPNAERWGRKSAWKNASVTKTIRVPEALADQVLDLAHRLDEGEDIDCDTKAKNEVEALKAEAEQLRSWLAALEQENDKLTSDLVLNPKDQELPDYEAARDRALAKLKLGKQAPEYKRAKKAMDLLLDELTK